MELLETAKLKEIIQQGLHNDGKISIDYLKKELSSLSLKDSTIEAIAEVINKNDGIDGTPRGILHEQTLEQVAAIVNAQEQYYIVTGATPGEIAPRERSTPRITQLVGNIRILRQSLAAAKH